MQRDAMRCDAIAMQCGSYAFDSLIADTLGGCGGRGGVRDVTAIFKMAPKALDGKCVNRVDFLLHCIIFLLHLWR